MRKWALGFAAFLVLAAAWVVPRSQASITCTLPFTLQNNTTADATQVMANYNALVTCFLSSAAAGVNSDITALTALSTPLTVGQGGTPVYVGGTSTGSANAQVVASASPIGFTLTAGKRLSFVAGFSNTGATTLNVNATGAAAIFRRTQLGVSVLVGGEIVVGQVIEAVYDGAQYQLLNQTLVGEGRDWFATSIPLGWLLQDGTSLLRAGAFADLFSVIGTTYGSADGTHFNVPDQRGRMSVAADSASRITGVCAAAATLGTTCGNTAGTVTIAAANVPQLAVTITDPGHVHTYASPAVAGTNGAGGAALGGSANTGSQTTGITATANTASANTALTVLNGSLVVNKIIKY